MNDPKTNPVAQSNEDKQYPWYKRWFTILIVSLGYIWSAVEIVAGEPFDALVLLTITMLAQTYWINWIIERYDR